jgi:hypothetical protein
MAETKAMFPKGTTASLDGYHSPTGELLVASTNTQAEVDAWNGVKAKPKAKAKAKVKAPVKKKKIWTQLKEELFPK